MTSLTFTWLPHWHNKKGTLFHWAVLGIIGVIGVFLILSKTFTVAHNTPGIWQLGVINNIQIGEVELLHFDIQARAVGEGAILSLAESGGFLDKSPCGEFDNLPLWNTLDQSFVAKWCFPPINENIKKIFTTKFLLRNIHLMNVIVDNSLVRASADSKTIQSKDPYLSRYVYGYQFAVRFPYSFDEYSQLQTEARFLVDSCRNQKDLNACLQSKKPVHWQYQSCDNPQAPSTGRIWKFCVESPSQSKIQNKPVRYSLALDFTPTTPFSVVGITVSPSAGKYKITFPRDANMDGYRIHYTDANLLDYRGKADQIIIGSGYFKDEREIPQSAVVDDPLRCGSGAVDQEAHKAYWCGGGLITYVLEDSRLSTGKDYYFTVAAFIGKEESEIAEFVKG